MAPLSTCPQPSLSVPSERRAGARSLPAPVCPRRWRRGWQRHALGFESPLYEQPDSTVERDALALGVGGQGCMALHGEPDVERHPRDGPGWHEVEPLWDRGWTPRGYDSHVVVPRGRRQPSDNAPAVGFVSWPRRSGREWTEPSVPADARGRDAAAAAGDTRELLARCHHMDRILSARASHARDRDGNAGTVRVVSASAGDHEVAGVTNHKTGELNGPAGPGCPGRAL